MYLLLFENYIKLGGGGFEFDKKLYSYDTLDEIYQYLDFEIFKHLEEDSDDYWDYEIKEVLNNDCGFFIYKHSDSGECKMVFESIGEVKWSDFYKFCFGSSSNEGLLSCTQFLESKKFPNIKKFNIDGFLVLMGKDSQSNDHLSINMSNDDDLWFHVKGVPGSHVLIRVEDKLPTPEVIKDVAEIAAKNSKGKGKVKVIYCKAKFVTKSSDMKPGEVNVDYINSEEIEIEI
jgi:hypothetical protein